MNMIVRGAGLILPVAVIGHALGALAYLGLIFWGLPIGWAIALALYSLFFMGNGYKVMVMFNQRPEMIERANVPGVPSIVLWLALLAALWFVRSGAAADTSQWWALLLPLVVVVYLALHWETEVIVDLVNPAGKRL